LLASSLQTPHTPHTTPPKRLKLLIDFIYFFKGGPQPKLQYAKGSALFSKGSKEPAAGHLTT
jgi:hypothetical protein